MTSDISPLQAQSLLKLYGVKPRKTLGQNFLTSASARELIIKAADLDPADVVLEIGPGLGALTEALANNVDRVICVELDESLYSILMDLFADLENVKIVQGDILSISPGDLGLTPGYVVVANIPYNITSAVIRHIMEAEIAASRVILTIQKEVAGRIVASPGEMSLLALSVQVFGVPSIKANIAPGSFYPAPSVESAVVRVDIEQRQSLDPRVLNNLFKLAKAGFAQRRKQLKNAFAHGLPLNKSSAEELLRSCDIEPAKRAQSLDVDTWFRLALAYEKYEET
jgi:16S rRNA (adenine1518-N6/adenine1519-N6)-dimethyltransferase